MASREREQAIKEAHNIAASEAYFEVRAGVVYPQPHTIFDAGFSRGWDAAIAANAPAVPDAQAQSCVPADEVQAMAEEIERLQKALAFWMPDVPSTDHPLYKRVANDVYLLAGYDGPNNEPSAFELGHVVFAASPQPQPVHDEIAYKEAVSLATALFKKHFAHEEHYASGRVVWGPCDTTAGVISQIDNMMCGLIQPQPVQPVVAYLDPKDLNELQCCNGMRVWAESPMVHDSPNATSASHLVAVYKASKPEQAAHPEQDLAMVAQPERVPLSDDQRYDLIVEHLGPSALTGGKMTPWGIFMTGISACEAAHNITKKD